MDQPKLPERYFARGVFSDLTGGLLNKRFLQALIELSDHTTLSATDKQRLFKLLVMVANKLGAVWYHGRRYAETEDDLLREARRSPIKPGQARVTIDCAPVLFYEFDATLVQAKSCLDHLVKIPRVCFGDWWNLTTFGAHGQDVVKLAGNAPVAYRPAGEGIQMLLEYHGDWLSDVIRARDRINHLQEGGIAPEQFAVFVQQDDSGALHETVPAWSGDQSARTFLELSWGNLLRFCEGFIGFALGARIQSGKALLHVPTPLDSLDCPWRVMPYGAMAAAAAGPGWTKFTPRAAPPRTPSRNDPCFCGSGTKYKKCCLPKRQAAARARRAAGV